MTIIVRRRFGDWFRILRGGEGEEDEAEATGENEINRTIGL